MNPRSYRILIKPVSTRVRCPVCHEEVYSRAGIHPQCAVRQSDPPRMKSKDHRFPTLSGPAVAEVLDDLPEAAAAASAVSGPV